MGPQVRMVTSKGVSLGHWRASLSMKSFTCVFAMEAPSWKIFNFLVNPSNLSRWALPENVSILPHHDEWLRVVGPSGASMVRMRANALFEAVDFHFFHLDGTVWEIIFRIVHDTKYSSNVLLTIRPPDEFDLKRLDGGIWVMDKKLARLRRALESKELELV